MAAAGGDECWWNVHENLSSSPVRSSGVISSRHHQHLSRGCVVCIAVVTCMRIVFVFTPASFSAFMQKASQLLEFQFPLLSRWTIFIAHRGLIIIIARSFRRQFFKRANFIHATRAAQCRREKKGKKGSVGRSAAPHYCECCVCVYISTSLFRFG